MAQVSPRAGVGGRGGAGEHRSLRRGVVPDVGDRSGLCPRSHREPEQSNSSGPAAGRGTVFRVGPWRTPRPLRVPRPMVRRRRDRGPETGSTTNGPCSGRLPDSAGAGLARVEQRVEATRRSVLALLAFADSVASLTRVATSPFAWVERPGTPLLGFAAWMSRRHASSASSSAHASRTCFGSAICDPSSPTTRRVVEEPAVTVSEQQARSGAQLGFPTWSRRRKLSVHPKGGSAPTPSGLCHTL